MGGRAFKQLNCPRISPDVYLKTRARTMKALRNIFTHVVVPTDMPSKIDYGDIDFLVSGFKGNSSSSTLDWPAMVLAVKEALNTPYGRRGHLNPSIMYFAIPGGSAYEGYGDGDKAFWIQVDIQMCMIPSDQQFEWSRFQLNYASGSKMLESLMKPLGLTINPDGMYIRVEEMEDTNFPGSMVFVSLEVKDVLRIIGLDWRILYGGFETREEIYDYFASSWIFNPAHFADRLNDEKYVDHLEERSAPWVYFVKRWMPERYPNYKLPNQDPNISLHTWYKQTRATVREKVFTLFPHITAEYYAKRKVYLKEIEEQHLQELLLSAILAGENTEKTQDYNEFPIPRIIIEPTAPMTPKLSPRVMVSTNNMNSSPTSSWSSKTLVQTPPSSPPSTPLTFMDSVPLHFGNIMDQKDSLLTPLHISALPRDPPVPYHFYPASNLPLDKKLVCIARWTHFSPTTGIPYLGREPREKKFKMCWSDSIIGDGALVEWVKRAWEPIWWRQSRVNYVGMWKHRFEREDAKAAKAFEKKMAKEMVELKETASLSGLEGKTSRTLEPGLISESD